MEAPRDLAAALHQIARNDGAVKAFAGGTDLMVLLEGAKLPGRRFVSIWKLPELRGIEVSSESVTLGALTTYTEIRQHELLRREFPLLCEAAAQTGSIATQNRGTLGGNIANASPAADSPPALLVYDAEVELASASGRRWEPYDGFWTGYKQIGLRPDELICRIRLPRRQVAWRQFYRKVGTRKAQAISKVCFAAAAQLESGRVADIRIALGSVAPTVFRAKQTENILRSGQATAALIGKAREVLAQEIAPIDDMRSTVRYRSRVAENLLEQFCATHLS